MNTTASPAMIGPHKVVRCIAQKRYFHIYEVKTPAGQSRALKLGLQQYVKAEYRFLAHYPQPRFVQVEKNSCAVYDGEPFEELINIHPLEDLPLKNATLGYFVMELLDGRTLKDCLDHSEEPANPILVVNQMLAISRALLPIWQDGFFHGDLNPNNIMCLFNGKWKLFDFHTGAVFREGMNEPDITYGTLRYLPRAELSSLNYTPSFRRDIYSAVLTIYEAVTRDRELFKADLRWKILNNKPISFRELFNSPLIPGTLRSFLLDVCCSCRWHRITEPLQFVERLEQVQEKLKFSC